MEKVLGLEIPQTLEDACDPRKLALLVYDMQVGILRQLVEPAAIIARALETLEAARAAGVRIFFVRHLSLPVELAGVFQLRQAMAWQRVARATEVRPWFLRDSPGFELLPELAPRSSEAIFDKITFSAFEGTPLDIALRDCGVNAFAICGVAIEIGIEPTVRHGADLGYIPVVVTDACGAGTRRSASGHQRASTTSAMPSEPTPPHSHGSSHSTPLRDRRQRRQPPAGTSRCVQNRRGGEGGRGLRTRPGPWQAQ